MDVKHVFFLNISGHGTHLDWRVCMSINMHVSTTEYLEWQTFYHVIKHLSIGCVVNLFVCELTVFSSLFQGLFNDMLPVAMFQVYTCTTWGARCLRSVSVTVVSSYRVATATTTTTSTRRPSARSRQAAA